MPDLRFTVDGEPRGKGRARFSNYGGVVRTYTPEATVVYENLIKLCAIKAMEENGIEPFDEAVEVLIEAHCGVPKSTPKAKRAAMLAGEILPTKKSDPDNIAKAVLDGLNRTAYRDDVQVVQLQVSKIYAIQPRLLVTVRPARRP